MTVNRSLRFQILRRDNYTCRYCGSAAPDVKLTVDHIVPSALGGSDKPENLITACESCNGGKSATPADASMVADVADDAIRWGRAMAYAAEKMLRSRDEKADLHSQFEAAWLNWGRGEGDGRVTMPLDNDWRNTIDRLMAAGLPMDIILDSIPVAMRRNNVKDENRFSYFCGVAWNRVTEMQETAERYLEAEGVDLSDLDEDRDEEDAFRYRYIVGQVFAKVPEAVIKRSRDRAGRLLRDHGLDETDDEVTYHTLLDLIDTLAEELG